MVPTPPPHRFRFGTLDRNSRLCVMKSCLCLVHENYYFPNEYEEAFDLWILKENKEDKKEFRSWIKELGIIWTPGEERMALDRLFALTKGSGLLIHYTQEIICFNLNTETATKIWVPKDNNWNHVVPLSHINSFVSLKTLGERNVETLQMAI